MKSTANNEKSDESSGETPNGTARRYRNSFDVVEERVYSGRCEHCGKTYQGEFSEGFVNPVQYGSNVKTLIALLNGYGYGNVTATRRWIS